MVNKKKTKKDKTSEPLNEEKNKESWFKRLEFLTSQPTAWKTNVFENLKETLKMQQSVPTKQRNNEMQLIGQFKEWLHDNGIICSFNIQDVGMEVLGLVALDNIQKESNIMKIPRKCMITTDMWTIDTSPFYELLNDPLIQMFPSILLVLHLLYEVKKKEKSFFFPYIALLPQTFHIPLSYTSIEEWKLLSSSTYTFQEALHCYYNSLKQYCYLKNRFQQISSSPFTSEDFNLKKFLWAGSIVLTRQNQIPSVDNSTNVLALIPCWDLCNHEFGAMTTSYDVLENELCFDAMKEIQPHEQIRSCYGHRANQHLLIYSGFSVLDNPYNYIFLDFSVDALEQLYKIRKLLLTKYSKPDESKIQDDIVSIKVHSNGTVDMNSEGMIQILVMNKVELSHLIRETNHTKMIETCEETQLKARKLLEQTILKNIQVRYEAINNITSNTSPCLPAIQTFLEHEIHLFQQVLQTK